MSIYDSLGNARSNASNVQPNAQAALQQLKANPAAALKQRGLNVPNGMTNPQQIINHLVQSGQLPQNRLTMAMQMLGMRR